MSNELVTLEKPMTPLDLLAKLTDGNAARYAGEVDEGQGGGSLQRRHGQVPSRDAGCRARRPKQRNPENLRHLRERPARGKEDLLVEWLLAVLRDGGLLQGRILQR